MDDKKLIKIVNKSGFPLQIGIESSINSSVRHEWKVLFVEHFWKDSNSNQNGFIDLILEKASSDVLVVECKRVKETDWIFLCDKKSSSNDDCNVKIWETFCENRELRNSGWHEVNIPLIPRSSESMFCVVSKKGNTLPPMLEKIAAELLSATESFAKEDIVLHKSMGRYLRRYISVIVTTAQLKICEYDPSEILISSGELKNAKFQQVPYIRFRKQFLNNEKNALDWESSSLFEISKAKENTIFVVNSDYLEDFLTNFRIV